MIRSANWLFPRIKNPISRVFWQIRKYMNLGPRSDQEAYYRLRLLSSSMPRYQPGVISLPFGRLRFVDALSLESQFLEIFLYRGYDFKADRADPLIFDCGGNIGLSVIRFKIMYPQSRIVVFEADPAIAEVLRDNLDRFCAKERINIINAAVWNKNDKIYFLSDGADSGRVNEQATDKLVDAVRLADCITEPVDLLKLDIEGAEYEVIYDLCQTGKVRMVHRIICEVHGRSKEDQLRLGRVLATLASQNFRFTFNHARCAPDLPGETESTPFPSAYDGKFLLHLYAWQGS